MGKKLQTFILIGVAVLSFGACQGILDAVQEEARKAAESALTSPDVMQKVIYLVLDTVVTDESAPETKSVANEPSAPIFLPLDHADNHDLIDLSGTFEIEGGGEVTVADGSKLDITRDQTTGEETLDVFLDVTFSDVDIKDLKGDIGGFLKLEGVLNAVTSETEEQMTGSLTVEGEFSLSNPAVLGAEPVVVSFAGTATWIDPDTQEWKLTINDESVSFTHTDTDSGEPDGGDVDPGQNPDEIDMIDETGADICVQRNNVAKLCTEFTGSYYQSDCQYEIGPPCNEAEALGACTFLLENLREKQATQYYYLEATLDEMRSNCATVGTWTSF